MKAPDVILKVVAKKISWVDAAEIIGACDRTMRPMREESEVRRLSRAGPDWAGLGPPGLGRTILKLPDASLQAHPALKSNSLFRLISGLENAVKLPYTPLRGPECVELRNVTTRRRPACHRSFQVRRNRLIDLCVALPQSSVDTEWPVRLSPIGFPLTAET